MRVPKSVAAAWAALIALAAGFLAPGCASQRPIHVSWDRSEEVSRARTWDWIDGDPLYVHAPFGDEAEVKAQLSALLEDALRERGLERASGAGEIRVAALLVGSRSYEVFQRARAMQTLYSHHDIGGFEVQADEMERRAVDRCRVAIFLTGPRQERMIWQAQSEERHTDGCARHLDDAVASLLDHLPPRGGASEDVAPR